MFSRSHSIALGAVRPQLVGQMDRNSTNAKPSFRSWTLKARRIADLALRTLAFDTEGLEVKGTYQDGRTEILDNSKLTFSTIPATVGEHKVVITANGGKTAEVTIKVSYGR